VFEGAQQVELAAQLVALGQDGDEGTGGLGHAHAARPFAFPLAVEFDRGVQRQAGDQGGAGPAGAR
jgi:hypothetical protein